MVLQSYSLVKISIKSMPKSLKSQNSEDSRLIFVRNWMTQPRQLLIPSQSPLFNNLISLMCLLMQNWSYFCGACWLDWISLIIKRIEWIRNFKHLLLITPPGAHCPVNRADHVRSALQHDLLPADPYRQRLPSFLHPEVAIFYICRTNCTFSTHLLSTRSTGWFLKWPLLLMHG